MFFASSSRTWLSRCYLWLPEHEERNWRLMYSTLSRIFNRLYAWRCFETALQWARIIFRTSRAYYRFCRWGNRVFKIIFHVQWNHVAKWLICRKALTMCHKGLCACRKFSMGRGEKFQIQRQSHVETLCKSLKVHSPNEQEGPKTTSTSAASKSIALKVPFLAVQSVTVCMRLNRKHKKWTECSTSASF